MHTSIRSPGFLGLGILLAFGTGYVLLEDVFKHGASVTTEHVMTALVLLVTLAAGHAFWPALRALKVMTALVLALVFAGGTFMSVAGSAGRAAKVLQHAEAEVAKIDDARKDAVDQLKTARADRAALQKSFNTECGSGRGVRCDGLKTALNTADDTIRLREARLDLIKPAEPANGEFKYMGEVFALFMNSPQATIEKALALVGPLAKASVLELATLAFLSLGLGHKTVPKQPTSKVREEVATPEVIEAAEPLQLTWDPTPILVALEAAKRDMTNNELAEQVGVSKGYMSKLVGALVNEGLVTKQYVGREVRISLVRH